MTNYQIKVIGLKEFQTAIKKNPQRIVTAIGVFLTRAIAAYNRGIIRKPWRIGQSGGGAPVDTGNLRDTHHHEIKKWQARIFPTAKYAYYVHDRPKYHHPRPWLNYVKKTKDKEIKKLEKEMLKNVVANLAK